MNESNTTTTQIREAISELSVSIGQQGKIVASLNSSMQDAKATLQEMMAQDGAIISQHFFSTTDKDGKTHHFVETQYYELVVDGDLSVLEKAYDDFDDAHNAYLENVQTFCNNIETLKTQAEVIDDESARMKEALSPEYVEV